VVDLYPLSFAHLVGRLKRELDGHSGDKGDTLFTLPRRDWWVPTPGLDVTMRHLAGPAGTSLGPASGPHTQMAQNIVMAWLGGSRFMELKTVQILDELELPRPCIHVPHIGYNVEWSQELKIEQSAREYVAAWWLVHLLKGDKGPGLWDASSAQTLFDVSLGYDLEGIQTPRMQQFVRDLKDCSTWLEKLRDELPDDLKAWADIDLPTAVTTSTTLSTFHGCPADQIEAIASYTLEHHGLHTVIKLNPTLLGHDVVRQTLDTLGYDHVVLDKHAFDADLKWDQLMDMLPRLQAKAQKLGLGFGVKFSNTLVCKSEEPPFPRADDGAPAEMYLSGPPLHVLACKLADKFSQATGGQFDHSFSAGIDPQNFKDAVAAGLQPITTCSDILKGQGYARLPKYLRNLEKDMQKLGATSLADYQQKRAGLDDTSDAKQKNLSALAESNLSDARYMRSKNEKAPKKIGRHLQLLDCLTCDKCIKVCPNMANITVEVQTGEWTPNVVSFDGDDVQTTPGEKLIAAEKHQIGNVVDLCNLCGQCDPWCPEDGGPYLEKPHLFIDVDAWRANPLDGFLVENDAAIQYRKDGVEYRLSKDGEGYTFAYDDNQLSLDANFDVTAAQGKGEVDLRIAVTAKLFLDGFASPSRQLFVEL